MKKSRDLFLRVFALGVLLVSQALSAAPPSVDLWTAAATGNIGALKEHKAAGTNLNAADPNGSSAVNAAAAMDQAKAAEWLLKNGAFVDIRGGDGGTPLITAAFMGNAKTAKVLLKNGADVTATNDGGASSLQVLGTDWDTTRYIIEDLLQLPASRKKIERGREQVGPLLYGALQEIAKGDFWTAVLIGDASSMKKHLAAGFDANTSHPELNVAPLILAVIVGSPDAAQALIDHGAKLDARGDDGSTALHAAALFGRTAAAKVLLDSGASAKIMNFQGVTPLDNARVDWPTTQYIAQLLQVQLQEDAAVEGKKAIEAMLSSKTN
ncbi:MAG TPA: ankyrin repeat domain-containing protein [Gammaproteobacteria bacterium]|nr:ankyrin repeat domain-containing protein [Gammaproteobacteria bacterium]